MPVGAESFSEALRCGTEIFHALKGKLHAAGLSTAVGDEGGFAPNIASARAALDFIGEAVNAAGYSLGDEVLIAQGDGEHPQVGDERVEDIPHGVDPGMTEQRLDRMAQHRLAAKRPILLRHAATQAGAAAGGDDQGGHGCH